ncbi:MAG: hypothetical protein GEU71_01725 [Actinobacteria bacterium]|nr:hypothetical protein [Actinomycetota bacterium]
MCYLPPPMTPAKKKTSKKTTARKKATSRSGPSKKAATKKTTAKKTTAKKASPKKAATKKTTARKATTKKAPAKKKTTAKKPAAKKTTAKKTTARKTSAKKPAAKKTAPKKPSAMAMKLNRPPKKPAHRTRPAKFDKKMLKEIRATLEDERAGLQRQQEELDSAAFQDTQSEASGEVGMDQDFADAGTATFDRERDFSIRNNIQDLVEQMTRAIARIDEGVYGTCERCGRPIDAARLRALPHALLCLDCKRREERER